MAPSERGSLVESTLKSSHFRSSTREFLLNASKLVSNAGMRRYYRIKLNALLDRDEDDINYIHRIAERSIDCIKCGNSKVIKVESRKTANKAESRTHCRYLHSFCKEYCDKCGYLKKHKLLGRKSICTKLTKPKQQLKRKADSKPKTTIDVPIKTKYKKIILPKPTQTNKPQFSSRLRAFSFMLKE